MKDQLTQTCFQIDKRDNVATALMDVIEGAGIITGDANNNEIIFNQAIKRGHKVALQDISIDEHIVKYGVVIGKATKDIKQGDWVHLHNCESLYDGRSATLDLETGAPSDTKYV